MNVLNGLKAIAGDVAGLMKRELDYHTVSPRSSLLFLTYRCNSRCRTCSFWKRPVKEEKAREIGIEGWKSIIDKLAASGVMVTEVFGGNVLLRKELLIPLLEYMSAKGMYIHMPTNQIGFDDDIAMAVHKYVDALYLSIDGIGEAQDKTRGLEGVFNQAQIAMKKITELRCSHPHEGRKHQRIICNTTVSQLNIDTLEDTVTYALGSGFDEIHLEPAGEISNELLDASTLDGLRPNAYYVKNGESILLNRQQAGTLHQTIRSIRRKHYLPHVPIGTTNLDLLSSEDLQKGTVPNKHCYMERLEITIDPAGNVVACPFFNNYITGNLLDNDLEDVWDNAPHRRFREAQNSGQIPMCKNCILGLQRNPTLLTSLKKVYLQRIRNHLSIFR